MQGLARRVLRPSLWKWIGVLLVCLLGTVGGTAMVRSGDPKGWFVALAFGLGSLVSGALLLPGAAYLELGPEGFTMCSLFRAHTLAWADVRDFGVGQVFQNKMVMFNFRVGHARSPNMRAFNVDLVGFEAALPDTYGLGPEALAHLMEAYKAASEPPSRPDGKSPETISSKF